jgi:hypothetical protein
MHAVAYEKEKQLTIFALSNTKRLSPAAMRGFVLSALRVLSSAPDIRHFRSMDDIRKWLNGSREYYSGVSLYVVHGTDPNLKRLFTAEGYSDFKNKKLVAALQAILVLITKSGTNVPKSGTNVPKTETSVPKIAPGANKVTDNVNKSAQDANPPAAPKKPQSRWSENMDDVEKSLFDRWKPLYAEMIDLQNHVGEISRKAETYLGEEVAASRMALRILELDKICDQIYEERNYYLENKVLPTVKDDLGISSDPRDWPTELASSKRMVRKWRNEFEKQNDPAAAAKLQWYQLRVDKLKKLLNKD